MCDEDDEQAILQLGGHNYTVSDINYMDLTVSVVDQEVQGQEACPRVDHNVSLPLGLSYPYSTVDYLFFFLNCSFNTTVTKLYNIDPIRCEIFGGPTAGLSFVLWQSDVPLGDWWQACQQVFEAPVLKHDLPTPGDLGWTAGGYGRYLRSGFQLAWNQKPPACNQCEQSNGQCGYNHAGEFVGCLCSGRRAEPHTCSSGHKKRTIIYIAASLSCLLLLCLLIPVFFLTRKYGLLLFKSKDETRIKSFLQKNENLHPKRYTYAEVKRMTKSFAVKLGQGGFGVVYKGNLYDGRQVAVKMLKDSKGDGEFMNEVASISRTSHVNVVTLLGFCLQGSKRALIYEYMPNGSLERYAFNNSLKGENTLTWDKLFDIAIGIARGLEYLHRGCNTRIVHFDIKPHNILLDHDLCPKISDFGLAKLCLNKESGISMVGARGTIGYIAPEVYSKQFGTISSKSDVYSYGMMVLEMVGARDKNINANSESSSQYFPQWIYEHLDDYCISASEINGETTELVRKMIVVGLWCIQVISTDRPTMTRVVEMLEGNTSNLELPRKPLLS
ncbi:LEAF RUST 10 DISEASE-RESISTANCE LOCUS RECEPTOR-LIKE PROTEIN KINASE-like 2.1 isoform X3 [Phragmites australis]|uniref:LEAF RUST 10 DISEASE-RESISTANCE LOCUS RECEPTOR-LIKE PROTEIN KINASE-like 2.1 isoform X3 n=1 Tax=Phragmites australis TaxID=29695 RepID=UPI002D781376|nr:LEAF RUST 10 DISEASE-RESISTANCE LOCUS RECEPTOR-LIKE PROTEIN KINASE-like 2.1 isoform X3 [Phragmites australis]